MKIKIEEEERVTTPIFSQCTLYYVDSYSSIYLTNKRGWHDTLHTHKDIYIYICIRLIIMRDAPQGLFMGERLRREAAGSCF